MQTLVPVNIDKCLQRKMFVRYYYLLVIITLKKRYSFFHAIKKILVVDQWLIHVKARKPVLEWNFIEKTLRYYNFGDSLITWVKLFYNEVSSCIQNNGWSSAIFNLTRGVRQGCPLSPYLFIHVLKFWETP